MTSENTTTTTVHFPFFESETQNVVKTTKYFVLVDAATIIKLMLVQSKFINLSITPVAARELFFGGLNFYLRLNKNNFYLIIYNS